MCVWFLIVLCSFLRYSPMLCSVVLDVDVHPALDFYALPRARRLVLIFEHHHNVLLFKAVGNTAIWQTKNHGQRCREVVEKQPCIVFNGAFNSVLVLLFSSSAFLFFPSSFLVSCLSCSVSLRVCLATMQIFFFFFQFFS